MLDPLFAAIENRRDQPPDEPYPRRFNCPYCGSADVLVIGAFLPLLTCGTCEHEWEHDE